MSAAALVLLLACTSSDPPPRSTPTERATVVTSPTAEATVVATPSTRPTPANPDAPFPVTFAQNEQIDVTPAVVFVDPHSGESTAWVFPEQSAPGFTVSPDGRSVFWTEFVPPSMANREALADQLFAQLESYLSPEQRDALQTDLQALAAAGARGESWAPIATKIVDDIRDDLPPKLADTLKDRLSDIASPRFDGLRWHLLRTDDGSDRVFDATSSPLAIDPVTGTFVANTAASDAGTSGPTVFGAQGREIRELPTHNAHYGPAWSPVGGTLAHVGFDAGQLGTPNTVTLYILPTLDEPPILVLEEPIPSHSPLAVEWSRDGERLALVTVDRVRVFTRDGERIWEATGKFAGNPRWSRRGFLHVNGVAPIEPGVDERMLPYAYLFDPDGKPTFRVRWFNACTGDPWLIDGSGIRDGRYVVLTTGELQDLGEERASDEVSPVASDEIVLRWWLGDDGTWRLGRVGTHDVAQILAMAPSLPFHRLAEPWTEDGRYVFATTVIGFDLCSEGVAARHEAPTVERPPYGP